MWLFEMLCVVMEDFMQPLLLDWVWHFWLGRWCLFKRVLRLFGYEGSLGKISPFLYMHMYLIAFYSKTKESVHCLLQRGMIMSLSPAVILFSYHVVLLRLRLQLFLINKCGKQRKYLLHGSLITGICNYCFVFLDIYSRWWPKQNAMIGVSF